MATVLITGGAKRIGRQLALGFSNAGFDILLHYNRSTEAAAETQRMCEKLGRRCDCIQQDLCEAGGVGRLFEAITASPLGGDLACIVNNASQYVRRHLADEVPSCLSDDFSINFAVPFEVMRLYHERYVRGHVINILDYRIGIADPASGGYGLAKKALAEATRECALEWAPDMRVNGIAPGIVMPGEGVPMEKMEPLKVRVPLKCATSCADIVETALFLQKMTCMTGEIVFIDGGLQLCDASRLGERKP